MPTGCRCAVDPKGGTYHVRITPRETRRGITARANSLVFETQYGEWVGALPVHRWVGIEELTDSQW